MTSHVALLVAITSTLLYHTEFPVSLVRPDNISVFKSSETLVDAGVKTNSCNEVDFEDEDWLDDNTRIENKEHKKDLQPKK
ncbi:hypothetical protein C2G38_2212176 [Gigaspora rosea]|uniref:Uncharacterized protein n=1 Tax=Gigaspora rosea TaxID=44941 RepID=A0A397UDK3_9GLOM|nr:hypothetical protein C2G38_2212176 [Gigaspora rosea]